MRLVLFDAWWGSGVPTTENLRYYKQVLCPGIEAVNVDWHRKWFEPGTFTAQVPTGQLRSIEYPGGLGGVVSDLQAGRRPWTFMATLVEDSSDEIGSREIGLVQSIEIDEKTGLTTLGGFFAEKVLDYSVTYVTGNPDSAKTLTNMVWQMSDPGKGLTANPGSAHVYDIVGGSQPASYLLAHSQILGEKLAAQQKLATTDMESKPGVLGTQVRAMAEDKGWAVRAELPVLRNQWPGGYPSGSNWCPSFWMFLRAGKPANETPTIYADSAASSLKLSLDCSGVVNAVHYGDKNYVRHGTTDNGGMWGWEDNEDLTKAVQKTVDNAPKVSIDADLADLSQYRSGYDLGDTVKIVTSLGDVTAQIVEAEEVYKGGSQSVTLTFGSKKVSNIRRAINQL